MSVDPSGLSEHYALKALFERELGRESFAHVKEFASLSAWKRESTKFLKVLRRSVDLTVMVADDDWRTEVAELLERGLDRVKRATSVAELHAGLAATLGELTFLQLGIVPEHSGRSPGPPIHSHDWNLSLVRSVQYVQSAQQKLDAARIQARRIPVSK